MKDIFAKWRILGWPCSFSLRILWTLLPWLLLFWWGMCSVHMVVALCPFPLVADLLFIIYFKHLITMLLVCFLHGACAWNSLSSLHPGVYSLYWIWESISSNIFVCPWDSSGIYIRRLEVSHWCSVQFLSFFSILFWIVRTATLQVHLPSPLWCQSHP